MRRNATTLTLRLKLRCDSMKTQFIVKSAVQKAIKEQKMCTSREFEEVLDKKVEEIVKKAAERAKANARNTVMARDI